MRRAVAAFLAMATMPLIGSHAGGTSSDAIPPERFQQTVRFTLLLVRTQDELERQCGRATKPGKIRMGCTIGNDFVVLRLPCEDAPVDYTARIVCHEAGHVAGWSGYHEP